MFNFLLRIWDYIDRILNWRTPSAESVESMTMPSNITEISSNVNVNQESLTSTPITQDPVIQPQSSPQGEQKNKSSSSEKTKKPVKKSSSKKNSSNNMQSILKTHEISKPSANESSFGEEINFSWSPQRTKGSPTSKRDININNNNNYNKNTNNNNSINPHKMFKPAKPPRVILPDYLAETIRYPQNGKNMFEDANVYFCNLVNFSEYLKHNQEAIDKQEISLNSLDRDAVYHNATKLLEELMKIFKVLEPVFNWKPTHNLIPRITTWRNILIDRFDMFLYDKTVSKDFISTDFDSVLSIVIKTYKYTKQFFDNGFEKIKLVASDDDQNKYFIKLNAKEDVFVLPKLGLADYVENIEHSISYYTKKSSKLAFVSSQFKGYNPELIHANLLILKVGSWARELRREFSDFYENALGVDPLYPPATLLADLTHFAENPDELKTQLDSWTQRDSLNRIFDVCITLRNLSFHYQDQKNALIISSTQINPAVIKIVADQLQKLMPQIENVKTVPHVNNAVFTF